MNFHFCLKTFGTSDRRFSRSAFGGRLATTLVSGLLKHLYSIFFFPLAPPLLTPLLRPFLIEGVLGSKNLFSKSCLERPNLGVGVDTFSDPVNYFGAPCLKLRFEKCMQCVRINV